MNVRKYTELQKQQCIELFNRKKLRPGESCVNNTDKQIAKEVGLKKPQVTRIITNYLKKKYD